jgi:hypothetical protein
MPVVKVRSPVTTEAFFSSVTPFVSFIAIRQDLTIAIATGWNMASFIF